MKLARVIERAIDTGVLPPGIVAAETTERPWPVVLLIALGAWVAAVPILAISGMLVGDWITDGAGTYVVGLLALAAAVIVLRGREVPVFVEQLAVPALLIGGGCLALGLWRDLPERAALGLLLAIALVLAWLLPRNWLRVLLGASAAALAIALLTPDIGGLDATDSLWIGVHGALACWMAALALQRSASAATAAAVEAAAAGWIVIVLAVLAILSGPTMLVGAAFGNGLIGLVGMAAMQHLADWFSQWSPWLSLLFGALGGGWLAQAWPGLRRPTALALLALLVLLCGLLPALGATLLVLSICLASGRWLQAGSAAVAAAWILGSFYYRLHWELATKAAVLVLLGAAFGALGWLMRPPAPDRGERGGREHAAVGLPTLALWLLAPLATLAVANVSIWQKERLIAHGDRLYMSLTPVDPRSLLQGDYMTLNFGLPFELSNSLDSLHADQPPQVVVRRDERNVGQVIRIHRSGEPLAANERAVQLVARNGRWTFVTDAWYFREGDGERWAAARFGEFRVDRSGRALLVGMADAGLEPIR